MADPTPNDDGTQAMPAGSGPMPPAAAGGSAARPTKIGRYEVRQVLGEGAFGRVFLAFDPRLNREVAIKLPKPEGLTADLRERFVREAWATATIRHPNVCPVYDVGDEGDLPYIVMHYQPGGTLATHLDKWKVLLPPQAVALAQKLAQGMAAAHENGVIHRDLKPANILFDPARHLAMITDFGLARIGGQAGSTSVGAVFGTPLYMSPEQARGETAAIGPHSDVYSLGVILYRMLTGNVPFDGTVYDILIKHNQEAPTPPSVARRGLDKRLDALVLKAMAKKPADRYPSAALFAGALGEYLRSSDTVVGGWSKPLLETDSPPSGAVPTVTAPPIPPAVPPLAPKPAGKSEPPVPPKPAGKSNPPAPPAVPLPPPRSAGKSTPPIPRPTPKKVLDSPSDDDGAFRQKVLLVGIGLLVVLMAVATVAILVTSKTPPTVATVEVPPNPPAPEPPKKDDPPPVPPVVKKDDPPVVKKDKPTIANNFAGHKFDAAAERKAAEWVLAQGGALEVRTGGAVRAVANATALPAGEFRVARIDLKNKPLLAEADMVAHLTGLSGPLEVSFTRCPLFGEEAMKAVAGIPELTGLFTIWNHGVTNNGLKAIANHPRLAVVDVRTDAVDRAGVKHLVTLPKLRWLTLSVPGSGGWLPDLAPLVELERLQVSADGPTPLTPLGLEHLKPFVRLKRLGLHGRAVTDAWVKPLLDVGLPALEELDLSESSVAGPGLALLKDFPRLDWIKLNQTSVRDAGAAHVAAARRVKWVFLVGCDVTDDGVRELVKNPDLRSLDLQDNKQITDAGAALLAACDNLKELDLTGTKVTTKGVEGLKKALPNCTVTHTDAKPAPAAADNAQKILGVWVVEKGIDFPAGATIEFTKDGKLVIAVTANGKDFQFEGTYKVEGDTLAARTTIDGRTIEGTDTITKLTDEVLETTDKDKKTATFKRKK